MAAGEASRLIAAPFLRLFILLCSINYDTFFPLLSQKMLYNKIMRRTAGCDGGSVGLRQVSSICQAVLKHLSNTFQTSFIPSNVFSVGRGCESVSAFFKHSIVWRTCVVCIYRCRWCSGLLRICERCGCASSRGGCGCGVAVDVRAFDTFRGLVVVAFAGWFRVFGVRRLAGVCAYISTLVISQSSHFRRFRVCVGASFVRCWRLSWDMCSVSVIIDTTISHY